MLPLDSGTTTLLFEKGGLLHYRCDAGTYSISWASRYAGLSPAVHFLKNDGSLRMIRRAETFADLTSHTVRDEDGEGAGDG